MLNVMVCNIIYFFNNSFQSLAWSVAEFFSCVLLSGSFPLPSSFPYSLSPLDHLLNLLFVSLFLLGPSDRQACQIHFLIKAV